MTDAVACRREPNGSDTYTNVCTYIYIYTYVRVCHICVCVYRETNGSRKVVFPLGHTLVETYIFCQKTHAYRRETNGS